MCVNCGGGPLAYHDNKPIIKKTLVASIETPKTKNIADFGGVFYKFHDVSGDNIIGLGYFKNKLIVWLRDNSSIFYLYKSDTPFGSFVRIK